MSDLGDLGKLALGAAPALLKLLVRKVGLRPGPDLKPVTKPHVYYSFYGSDGHEHWACAHCPRSDDLCIRYTDPPCPRNYDATKY